MFQPLLKEKFQYFTNYFESVFENKERRIPQSIILYGQDSLSQYYIAQDIARILNCIEKSSPDCKCINCNWIRQNQHPSVMTVTRESSKKSIPVEQIRAINNSLVNTSEYYRVFIICDSETKDVTKFEQEHMQAFSSLGFRLPSETKMENWYPHPLNKIILHSESSNALLKSIEEPPENVIFIFLTEDKENLLETIVSRSQSFYIPSFSFSNEKYDMEFVQKALSNYPDILKSQVPEMTKYILELREETGYDFEYVFDCMQYYFKEMIKQNAENKNLLNQLKICILSLQNAKKEINSYIKPNYVIENFLFSIAK